MYWPSIAYEINPKLQAWCLGPFSAWPQRAFGLLFHIVPIPTSSHLSTWHLYRCAMYKTSLGSLWSNTHHFTSVGALLVYHASYMSPIKILWGAMCLGWGCSNNLEEKRSLGCGGKGRVETMREFEKIPLNNKNDGYDLPPVFNF